MNRRDALLQHIDKQGLGLEIGPSHSPVAPKKAGYQVHVMDHLDQAGLREKYRDQGVDVARIEPVDFIWSGQSYAELTGNQNSYDWIIASHLIEHTPDLIGFLNDCTEILKDEGVLSLAIPDKRFCFDRYRPMTGIAQVIDAHREKRTTHSSGAVIEHMTHAVSKAGRLGWNSATEGEITLNHPFGEAERFARSSAADLEYLDIHAWCFVPHAFRLLIHDLHQLNLIALQELSFQPTEGCEFYMTLSRKASGPQLSRLALMEKMQQELSEQSLPPNTVKNRLKNLYWRFRDRHGQ